MTNLEVDGLPFFQLLAPLLFVFGTIYLLGPTLPMHRPWARVLVFAAVWLIIARHTYWRVFTTLLPAQGEWYQVGWIWFCFAVEAAALADSLILYVCFLRTTDRRAEADAHEARLLSLPAEQLPSIDVYIPTYNEPMEVLDKAITGALHLDYPNLSVWVLDDGRRPWLKAVCEEKGAGYLTRPDNTHAKAGNINHALTKTDADFVAIFDADFVPQRNFLMRTMGFFADPKVAIVQVPHAFYNHDPMQANLALRKSLPDDQRFFFEAIMPSRDAWDAAFCCGSNSVTRRSALRSIGDALPTQSITEDMLLSVMLLRKGLITRYLCERLAFGLAPESVQAFFVQRERWARGATQILFIGGGIFGGGLTVMQRLLFLPVHWITQSLMLQKTIITPIVFMWTGLLPLVNVTFEAIVYYLLPMVIAVAGGIRLYAPHQYFPLASQVLGTFQSFRVLPTALATIVSPFNAVFKVTPKGADAAAPRYDRRVFWTATTLMVLTIGGMIINAIPEWRIVTQSALIPVVAGWGIVNATILFIVCMMSLQVPVRRAEERFAIDEPISFKDASGTMWPGRSQDVSLSGICIKLEGDRERAVQTRGKTCVFVQEVGCVAATVVRERGRVLGLHYAPLPPVQRELLTRKLFTSGLDTTAVTTSALEATIAMLASIAWTRSSLPKLGSEPVVETAARPSPEKLPPVSLVIPPRSHSMRTADLAPSCARSDHCCELPADGQR